MKILERKEKRHGSLIPNLLDIINHRDIGCVRLCQIIVFNKNYYISENILQLAFKQLKHLNSTVHYV